MLIAVDFDGVVVDDTHAYADLKTPLRFVPGALAALQSFKRADHILVLYSGRANRALREDPNLDPLVRGGVVHIDRKTWLANRGLHIARYEQMLQFIEQNLPGVFDAIDDGMQGKPAADLYIDDKAYSFKLGLGKNPWAELAYYYGYPSPTGDTPNDQQRSGAADAQSDSGDTNNSAGRGPKRNASRIRPAKALKRRG